MMTTDPGKRGGIPAESDSSARSAGITRRDFLKYSAGTVACLYLGVLNTGCGGRTMSGEFPLVVFSDVHFNPFYDPSLFSALVAADAGGWADIFRTSAITAPSAYGKDANYPLLALALTGITENLGASPFVVFTGDILGHGIPQLFYHYLNGTLNPRNAADIAAMKAFTDKAVAFFTDQVRAAVGNIPVMFAVGNGDSYSGYGPNAVDSSLSPDNSFLVNTAELFFTKFLNGTADHQTFLSTFTIGGYYCAEPAGTNLMVIGLNTIMFSPLVSPAPGANDAIAAAQLDWLGSRLGAAKVAGKKVWLLMHAPPGADVATTARPANVGANGHIATATMMWEPAYQARFLQIISNYPGVVSLTLAGHTHMDEYRTMPSSDVLEITPSIAPFFGNNPAFKIFTVSRDTLKPTDYSSLNCDLTAGGAHFSSYYTFSTAYSTQGPLDASLTGLTPALVTNTAKQALYRGYYYSGNNSSNSITDTNWPIFWSGIGKIEQQSFIDSVNSYPR
jgi:hypothetical protein